jgi:hypothetical protein
MLIPALLDQDVQAAVLLDDLAAAVLRLADVSVVDGDGAWIRATHFGHELLGGS